MILIIETYDVPEEGLSSFNITSIIEARDYLPCIKHFVFMIIMSQKLQLLKKEEVTFLT